MREIVVLSGADAHVQEAYGKLEERADGRGDAFYMAFVEACSLLSHQPEIGKRYYSCHRRLVMRRWNVGVFYSIEGSRIMISAVMDLRQNPRAIRRYLDAM